MASFTAFVPCLLLIAVGIPEVSSGLVKVLTPVVPVMKVGVPVPVPVKKAKSVFGIKTDRPDSKMFVPDEILRERKYKILANRELIRSVNLAKLTNDIRNRNIATAINENRDLNRNWNFDENNNLNRNLGKNKNRNNNNNYIPNTVTVNNNIYDHNNNRLGVQGLGGGLAVGGVGYELGSIGHGVIGHENDDLGFGGNLVAVRAAPQVVQAPQVVRLAPSRGIGLRDIEIKTSDDRNGYYGGYESNGYESNGYESLVVVPSRGSNVQTLPAIQTVQQVQEPNVVYIDAPRQTVDRGLVGYYRNDEDDRRRNGLSLGSIGGSLGGSIGGSLGGSLGGGSLNDQIVLINDHPSQGGISSRGLGSRGYSRGSDDAYGANSDFPLPARV